MSREKPPAPFEQTSLLPGLDDDGPWTAALVDENEPDGLVELRNESGSARYFTSRKTFEWFQHGRKG